eukprot:scaffold307153_cov48-Attheya_sp.AAC.1
MSLRNLPAAQLPRLCCRFEGTPWPARPTVYTREQKMRKKAKVNNQCVVQQNMRFAPSFLLAHGSGIFAIQPQLIAPTPKGSS